MRPVKQRDAGGNQTQSQKGEGSTAGKKPISTTAEKTKTIKIKQEAPNNDSRHKRPLVDSCATFAQNILHLVCLSGGLLTAGRT